MWRVIAVVGTACESSVGMVAAVSKVGAKGMAVVVILPMKGPMIGVRGMVMAILSQGMHGTLVIVPHLIASVASAPSGSRRSVSVRVIVTV
jgi:hypothetical protein